jgi:hypothetical protein
MPLLEKYGGVKVHEEHNTVLPEPSDMLISGNGLDPGVDLFHCFANLVVLGCLGWVNGWR